LFGLAQHELVCPNFCEFLLFKVVMHSVGALHATPLRGRDSNEYAATPGAVLNRSEMRFSGELSST
jgi:hypothetical protein